MRDTIPVWSQFFRNVVNGFTRVPTAVDRVTSYLILELFLHVSCTVPHHVCIGLEYVSIIALFPFSAVSLSVGISFASFT